jgi:hypothetical protein
MSGLAVVLLGLWGALIPFVGPYFDYSFGTNATWHYTTDRLWLDIIPGAVAVLGGLLLLSSATRMRGMLGGWLAIIAGAWFAIGPAVSVTWEHGRGPIGAPLGGTTRQALELIGYFYGLGALIVALGAFAAGRFASRPHVTEEVAAAGAAVAAARGRPKPARGRGRVGRRAWPLARRRGARTTTARGGGAPTSPPAGGGDAPTTPPRGGDGEMS